jgi:DNA repair protein RadD
MTMQLRDYQSEAVEAVYRWFDAGRGNPLIVAPTGAGKSVILSSFIQRAVSDYPDTRVILATHVKELIAQNYQALLRLWPSAPAGIYSAGLGRRQMRQITFAGIQSVAKKAADFGHVDLLVVDEAHLIPRSGTTQYQTFIAGLQDTNPALKVVGLTATPFRLDSGRLDTGDGAIFDGIAYDIPIGMLVERGYLAPLISKRPGTVFDVRGLHTRGGEWIESEMDARFNNDTVTRAAVAEVVALGADRRSWLLFCISVDHAAKVRDELARHGVAAAMVTGQTPPADRARILADFKAGHIRAITNVNVLTTGFDAPATDLLAFLRPTQSLGLYMQMAGRAMRTAPGKENGLVLDFAGNVARHGPVDAISVAEGKKPGEKAEGEFGETPAKTCPDCESILWIGARECPDCGHEFPPPEPKIEHTASTEAIMNLTAHDNWQELRDFAMARHVRRDTGTVSLRVEYLVGSRVIKDFVCLEHTGFARQKAVAWWRANAGTSPPDTVAEALERIREVRVPAEVVIRKEGEWWRVVRQRGDKRMGEAA